MASSLRHACERCGRLIAADARCREHPGARQLDLRRRSDREWRDDLIQLRRQRWARLASFTGMGLTAVGGLIMLAVFLYGGIGAHAAVRKLGVVHGVAQLLHGSVLLAQLVAVGLALANVARWIRNARARRAGRFLQDPLAWRKAPYVVGALIHGLVMGIGLTSGWLSAVEPLAHLGVAVVVSLAVMGGLLLVDVADLAAHQVRRAESPPLPEPSWESWAPLESVRGREPVSR